MAKKIKVIIKLQIPAGKANAHSSSLCSSSKPLPLRQGFVGQVGFVFPLAGHNFSEGRTPSRSGILVI